MACEMDLNTLRQETLASALTTTAKDGATAFGLHAGTEAELAFARALGWLVGALHVVIVLKNRVADDVWKEGVCQMMIYEKLLFTAKSCCSTRRFLLASNTLPSNLVTVA